MVNHLTWQLIDEVAAGLGATESARFKWRQRSVPAKWRIDIARELMRRGITVSLDDFDKLPVNPGRIGAAA